MPCSALLMSALFTASGALKSISATHIGSTSDVWKTGSSISHLTDRVFFLLCSSENILNFYTSLFYLYYLLAIISNIQRMSKECALVEKRQKKAKHFIALLTGGIRESLTFIVIPR